MSDFLSTPCTTFAGHRRLASGSLIEVALAIKAATNSTMASGTLTFNDQTGAVVDFDLRGTTAEIVARLAAQSQPAPVRGRPKLGVVAREVTLLPRQWEWLAQQPGGASQALRRLVDVASRMGGDRAVVTAAREAAFRFMSALAGDLAGFEEATRALFAGDCDRFAQQIAAWPADIRDYATKLASAGLVPAVSLL